MSTLVESQPPSTLPAVREQTGSWPTDLALAALVLVVLAALRPLTPDGDGLYHAGRAIDETVLHGMVAKHPLYAAALRLVYLGLDAVGLRAWTLSAFALLSCLCGAGLYLVLARGLYPPLLGDRALSRLCALGTLASYGVMQCCCSIETYAPALLLDAALVTVCLRCDVAAPRGGILAGLLFVLAVGMHATNSLFAPFLLAVLWYRLQGRSWTTAGWAVGTVALGGVLIAAALLAGSPGGWPPDWHRLIPKGDPEPALSVAGRLGRTVYGWLRTVAWLVPSWELTRTFAAVYAPGWLTAGLLVLYVARHGLRLGSRLGSLAFAALIAVPFLLLGVWYFPSDPERWLFLTPILWLLVGWIWADYRPASGALLSTGGARLALALLVAGLALFNGAAKLWPEARHDRGRSGGIAMTEVAGRGDLVVSPSGMTHVYQEFVIGKPFDFEVLAVDRIMLEQYPKDVPGGQAELNRQVRDALRQGRRVFVHALFDEGLHSGRGYPWAWVETSGYSPGIILEVLKPYRPEAVVRPGPGQTGTYRLSLPEAVRR
jgi:hypothetical protein